ncbi:oxidoreductase [Rhodococcus opacus]|uniref:oxidoreductase n=1 Tax=Rhodococcus opacus TaxID=37919 RepID=UPI00155A6721|nr:FAD-dependent oxidoreductase [Rhodococcus opacus]
MGLSDRYDILFEPVRIGPKTARNRFWQTPHATGFGTDFPGAMAGYREMKAEGGWGVVFTEATSIAPEVDKSPYVLGRMWDEGDVRNSRHVVDRIHERGSLAGTELEYHSSVSYVTEGRGLNSRGVIPVAGESGLAVSYAGTCGAMDVEDIEEIQELHVKAALRARDAGFDLITLHCGHAASILAHFLIPYYNTRTDEYGGSFENRARFARETVARVREAVGDSVAVGLRFGVDTLDEPMGLGDRGIRADGDAPRFIELMDDLVDYWDLVIGGFDWGQDAQSSRTAGENHEAQYVGHLKKYTTKPVVNVGRFSSPDTMVKVIRSGQCDFIGAARASISDPFLPEKIRTGAIDEIRECIGCNMCVSRANIGNGRIVCTQNATIGEEFRRGWHPERFTPAKNRDKNVLVIGAGPAGMECAMVLGKRGMDNVHLVEATDALGGCLNWITKIPGRVEWRHIIEYREHQFAKLKNVDTIFNTHLSADDVLDYGAEIVVVATGSKYILDGVSPFDRRSTDFLSVFGDRLLTPEDVLDHGKQVGERVLIVDTDGYFVGPGIAEYLARKGGHHVAIATPAEALGYYTKLTMEHSRMMADLRDVGVTVHVSSTVTAASAGTVTTCTPDSVIDLEADTVILVGQRQAQDDLYRDLRARANEWETNGVESVYRIGDCARPNFIADAIFSGHRLAREIDAPHPEQPLPFVRERRLIESHVDDFVLGGRANSSIY